MTRIIVVPERLHDLSAQLNQSAQGLSELYVRLGRISGSLDWDVRQKANVDATVQDICGRARSLVAQANEMAQYLVTKAQAFAQADKQGAVQVSAPYRQYFAQTQPYMGLAPLSKEVIGKLDDLLQPIDWISDSRHATKVFNATLVNVGRLMNSITGTRGYIKSFTQLGKVLTGTAKTVNAASNLLTLRDFATYFSGKSTNLQAADAAIKALVPVPILNDKVATWLTANMPDPNGRWRGLVTPVEYRIAGTVRFSRENWQEENREQSCSCCC